MVDFPTMVQDALTICGAVLDTAAAHRHFAASLTGLIVAANTTVRGINRACARTTDHACLPRGWTAVHGEVTALHAKRRAWLQQAPHTR
jgi:hypothetical protein